MINQNPADKALDDAIAKVDESMPAIRRMAAKKQKRATDRLPADQARRAQEAFLDMKSDPLLTPSGDDICTCSHTKLVAGDSRHCKGQCH